MKTHQASSTRPETPFIDDRDLASLERRTLAQRFADGSMDVVFGIGVLLVGLTWVLDMVTTGAAVPAILIPLWIVLYKQFVLPRIGYAEPTLAHQRTERSSLGLTIVLGLVIFAQLVLAAFGGSFLGQLPASLIDVLAPGIPAILVALFALVGGMIIRQREGSSYALTLVAVALIGGMNDLEPGTILLISGALITLQAARKFAAFLRAHPLVEPLDEEPA